MTPVPVHFHVPPITGPALPASAVFAICVCALALVGGALLTALERPQVYLLRVGYRQIQQSLPNQDIRESYARFVGDVLTNVFTFNGYTASQSESFLARYAEEPAALVLWRLRQRAFVGTRGRPQSALAIRSIQIGVQRGLPTAFVDALWTWSSEGSVATQPIRLVLTLTSVPSRMAHHFRLSILTADLVTP